MIKKTLLLIISTIGMINLTYGYFSPTITIQTPGNFNVGNIKNTIDNKLNFSNTNGRYLLINDEGNTYNVFRNNGELYSYSHYTYNNQYGQGYYRKFCSTIGTGYCADNYTEETAEIFYNLENANFTQVMISIQGETDDPGFCFYNQNEDKNYCTNVYGSTESNLSGSLNIPNGTTSFAEYTKQSPFNYKLNDDIDDNYVCPTIAQVMKSMGDKYNTGLCYNNTSYFNGTSFTQVDKQDIFTIFNNSYENYTNRISTYRNNCNSPANNTSCSNAFSGEFKKYSIISNAINSNVDEKNLRNYCNLGLNYDSNATTCVLNSTGIVKESYTTEEQIQNIINYGAIPTPTNTTINGSGNNGNNNVINILNNSENGREEYINDRNFIDSLTNIYGKITGLFRERKNVNGLIPEYILRITYITLLFTVILKK